MKSLNNILSLVVVAGLFTFMDCGSGGNETAKDKAMKLLMSKTWTVESATVPSSTATEESDWQNFTVKFSNTYMTTAGHPTGASYVWPSGTYTLSDDGKTISRSDGVDITVITLTESAFSVTFTVPAGTVLGGRVAALDGDYTFNMK